MFGGVREYQTSFKQMLYESSPADKFWSNSEKRMSNLQH